MTHQPKRLKLFAITWPIFVESLLTVLMGLFGLWLANRLSVGAVAVFGVATQIIGGFLILFRVVSIGTSVVVTQYHGAGDHAGAGAVARAGVATAFWIGLASLVLLGPLAGPILRLLNLPVELMAIGQPYVVALGAALAFDSVGMSMIAVLRASTHTREAMRIVLLMNLLQVLLSFPLMFGFAGIPAMGLVGLAVAMVLSRIFALVLLWYVWRSRLSLSLRWADLWRINKHALSGILHIGLPAAGEKIAFRISFIMTVAMVGSMGAAALATHTYVMQAVSVVTLFVNAVGFGTEIVVGHLIGAGELKRANKLMWRATAWGQLIMVLCVLTSYFVTPYLVGLATPNAEILRLVGVIVLIELFLEPGRTFNSVVSSGLAATGDARFAVKVGAVSVFVFGAGLGWLLGVHFGMGLPGIWIGYAADEWARGLSVAARWVCKGWVPYARATRRKIIGRRSPVLT